MRILILFILFIFYSHTGYADIVKHTDIAYGNDVYQKLDIYVPKDIKDAPILLMVHGGAWKIGDKNNTNVVSNKVKKWGEEGFIVVSVNYRLLPTQPYNQAQDLRRALVYVQENAATFGGHPDHIIMMGHSAGGHLVALVTADPARAYTMGAKPWKGSVLLDSVALNVVSLMKLDHVRLYDKAFGNKPFIWKKSSPFHHLHKDAPPMLLVCSTQREDSCPQAEAFSKQAKSIGAHTQILKQDLSHRHINKYLGLESPYTQVVSKFIDESLRR